MMNKLKIENEEKETLESAIEYFTQANNREASIKINYILAMLHNHFKDKNKALRFLEEIRSGRVPFREVEEGNMKVVNFFQTEASRLWDDVKYGK